MNDRNTKYGVLFLCAVILAFGMIVSVHRHNSNTPRFSIVAAGDCAYRLDTVSGYVYYIKGDRIKIAH